jgi:hypothetical protein
MRWIGGSAKRGLEGRVEMAALESTGGAEVVGPEGGLVALIPSRFRSRQGEEIRSMLGRLNLPCCTR